MKNYILFSIAILFFSCDNKAQEEDEPIITIDYLEGFSSDISILDNSVSRLPEEKSWAIVEALTDEFEASKLDASKWDDFHPHWNGRAPSNFKKGNAYVENGNLKLKSGVRKDPSTVNNPEVDIWVDAAACVSKEKSAKVGYFYEVSMKASSLSMSSAIWFRVGNYSEIDIIEHIGNASNSQSETLNKDLSYQYHTNAFHYTGNIVHAVERNEWTMQTRGRDEYHVYGLWWKDPNTLQFYHNGKHVMTTKPPVAFDENLKMIFDTEVFPEYTASWGKAGLPLVANLNDNTKNTASIEYVRTYKITTSAFNAGLLKNGSFESDGFNHWFWKGDVKLNNNTLNLNDGVQYLELENEGSMIQKVTVQKNTNYTLKFNSKTNSGSGLLEISDIKSKTISSQNWTSNNIIFNSGNENVLYIKFSSEENGNINIDAVSLKKS